MLMAYNSANFRNFAFGDGTNAFAIDCGVTASDVEQADNFLLQATMCSLLVQSTLAGTEASANLSIVVNDTGSASLESATFADGGSFVATLPVALGLDGDDIAWGSDVLVSKSSATGAASAGELLTYDMTWNFNSPAFGFGGSTIGRVVRNARLDASGDPNPDTGPVTGAEIDLIPVADGQTLYTAVFLLAFTGTDVTFTFETDVTGFAVPTTRTTHAALTAPQADVQSVTPVGGITPDDKIRVNVTGTFTSATYLAVHGVA